MSPNLRPSFLCLPKTLNPKFMPPNPGSYFLSLPKNPKPMAPNPRPSFLCFPKTLNPESMPSNPWCCSFRLPKNPKPMSPNPWPSFPSHPSKSLQFSFIGVFVEFHDEFKHVRDSTCCCILFFSARLLYVIYPSLGFCSKSNQVFWSHCWTAIV